MTTPQLPPLYESVLATLNDGKALSDIRDAAILALLIEGPLTRLEIINLRYGDYDVDRAQLTVRHEDKSNEIVPLNERTQDLLARWRKARGRAGKRAPLFLHLLRNVALTDEPLHHSNIYYMLNKHNLRHATNEIVPRQTQDSSLTQYLEHHTLPEVGYTPINLRLVRIHCGLSQRDVAQLLDVQMRTIQNWEAQSNIFRNMPYTAWQQLIEYAVNLFEKRALDEEESATNEDGDKTDDRAESPTRPDVDSTQANAAQCDPKEADDEEVAVSPPSIAAPAQRLVAPSLPMDEPPASDLLLNEKSNESHND